MHSMKIKRELPEVPPLNRDYKKRPRKVIGEGKYIRVLPSEYCPKKPPIPTRIAKPKPRRIQDGPGKYQQRKFPRQQWTEEKINEVIRLYYEGLKFSEIGERMNCSERMAYMLISKCRKEGKVDHRRNSQGWTAEQDEILIELYNKGQVYADIGLAVGKSRTAVRDRLVRLHNNGRIDYRKDNRCKKD